MITYLITPQYRINRTAKIPSFSSVAETLPASRRLEHRSPGMLSLAFPIPFK
jgi:hypothetical protein